MQPLKLRPPAKLNLFLHILGRRSDGYHSLQTVFELIDWTDELELQLRDDGQIERIVGAIGVAAQDDLCVRAARLLKPLAPAAAGCDIRLTKHIPTGAGLGGGSADAAAVLLGLNRLWRLGLPLAELAVLGARLGADVPVFVQQQPCFAEGIGECLQPLPLLPRQYLVVYPGVALATAAMFAASDLRRDCAPITLDQWQAGEPTSNVFQPLARTLSPEVARAELWLEQRFGPPRLSGSGSALFVPIADAEAASARMRAAPASWRWRCVRSTAFWFDNPVPQA